MFHMMVAGLRIEVHHRYSYIEKQCADWECPDTDGRPDIAAEAPEEEIQREMEFFQEQEHAEPSPGVCESICIYRSIARQLTSFSAFVMHGAAVELDGQAYVFAAKSGVGKTTHTRLWLEYFEGRAKYINGDKPIMRWIDGKLYACGTPWMGKERYGCQDKAPVRAFCFLEQAGENQIRRAKDGEIVERLFHQVLLPEEPEQQAAFMTMMDKMVRTIPFYILKCTISKEAVKLAYRTMKERQDWNYLFSVIRYSLAGGPCPEASWTPDWKKLYQICERHKIGEMVYNGFSRMPAEAQPPADIMNKLSGIWQLGTARDAAQRFGLEELSEAFEAEHIYFVPLKGVWMKQFYPSPELRMMADIDILYRPEQEEDVNRVLLSKGYEFDHRDNNHSVYFRRPFMNIEMHHLLISYKEEIEEYYKDVWQKVRPDEGKTYRGHFSWEDYYIFMMVHLAKHLQSGGSGIRSVVDIWLFLDKKKTELNWKYIGEELKKIRLDAFESHMKKLAAVWFENEEPDEFEHRMTAFIIKSGVYGTTENISIRQVVSKNKNSKTLTRGKFLARMKLIFLPYEYMHLSYKYLDKFPWLLPVAWVQRILRTLFKKRGRASEVLATVNVDEKKALANQEIYRELNI